MLVPGKMATSTSHIPEPHVHSNVITGTLLFVRSTVEVVVDSHSFGIEEPASAQPNELVVASPDQTPKSPNPDSDASAGTSCLVTRTSWRHTPSLRWEGLIRGALGSTMMDA